LGRHYPQKWLSFRSAPTDLRRLAQEAIAPSSGSALSKGIEIVAEVDADVPERVLADPLRLRQVLINLTGNAVKFTHQGQVGLRIRRSPAPDDADAGIALHFEVSDTGIGIAENALPHIFEAFTQADGSTARRYGGTGLGLTIASRLVRQMGGELHVDSRPGRGSRFHCVIRLPEIGPVSAADGAAAVDDGAVPGPRPEVLVVDDCPVNQEVAREMFRHLGIEIELASDGRQALHCIARRRFDLVFMDCMLPEIDGYETTRRIRALESKLQRDAAVPVIAFSASITEAEAMNCFASGMNDVLPKPMSIADLRQMLARWCSQPNSPGACAGSTASSL
jgi:CheY-like chemotaxis protein